MIYENLNVRNSDTKVFGISKPARSCINLKFLKTFKALLFRINLKGGAFFVQTAGKEAGKSLIPV